MDDWDDGEPVKWNYEKSIWEPRSEYTVLPGLGVIILALVIVSGIVWCLFIR